MSEKSEREELDKLRHSAAHLLAAAVLELRPAAKLTLGPATDDGFYYDIDFVDTPLADEDLSKIEKKMSKLLPSWKEFSHEEVSAEQAREMFRDNEYKLELIDEIAARGEKITIYTVGDGEAVFADLCRGGHVASPSKELKHFKLLKIAGAYWRGDVNNQMLTRIYGTAFKSREELDEYLNLLEEAKKRDHRKLGRDLDLFTFSPLVGPGLPLFTPKGAIIRRELENFVQSLQEVRGYERVWIPHIAKSDLYKTSGHWEKFQADLFHVRGKRAEELVLKPMNCPHHTQIYAGQKRSYRDLPLRFSEVGTVYRDEQAGELIGLTRVRSITQDDAHVFCRPDQIKEEVQTVMQIIGDFYAAFDFELQLHLSRRDVKAGAKYLGDDEVWNMAEEQLREALQDAGLDFVEDAGEAAFYGPKIDYVAKDSLGRRWQLATVQLDFNMPRRFSLSYTDEAGAEQTPVMIHRAVTGSLERFMAILLEHYNGALPLWLSPTQAIVLPISDEQNEYAEKVLTKLVAAGLRVEIDRRAESIGKKIREAEKRKAPVMLIVGKKEVTAGTVAVREREVGDAGKKKLVEVVKDLIGRVDNRES